MTDDTIPSHAEALAEIKRLRARIAELDTIEAEKTAEIVRLRDDLIELETARVVTFGTLAAPTPDDDQPATYTHNVPPNAPR